MSAAEARENIASAYSALGAIALHTGAVTSDDDRVLRAFVEALGALSSLEMDVDAFAAGERGEGGAP